MKRIVMTALLLVVATSFSVAVAQGRRSVANKAGLEKTVNIFFEVIKANDLEKLRTYYTADYTFTGPDGKMVGVEERLKLLKEAGGSNFVSASDLNTRIYGNTGVVTGIATTKTEGGGTEQSRFVQVWTWNAGRWRLALSQVTRIA